MVTPTTLVKDDMKATLVDNQDAGLRTPSITLIKTTEPVYIVKRIQEKVPDQFLGFRNLVELERLGFTAETEELTINKVLVWGREYTYNKDGKMQCQIGGVTYYINMAEALKEKSFEAISITLGRNNYIVGKRVPGQGYLQRIELAIKNDEIDVDLLFGVVQPQKILFLSADGVNVRAKQECWLISREDVGETIKAGDIQKIRVNTAIPTEKHPDTTALVFACEKEAINEAAKHKRVLSIQDVDKAYITQDLVDLVKKRIQKD